MYSLQTLCLFPLVLKAHTTLGVCVTWLRTGSLCDFCLSWGRNTSRKEQGPDDRNQVLLNTDIPFWTKKSFLYHAYFPC